ncbi:MAG: MATE family efflux transporter [Spirochaetales bacterium]|nr:MATE family efflux transporter [Spirochaetales bacterium]
MAEALHQGDDSHTELIRSGNLVSLFFKFAVPAVLAMIMVGLYQFVDAIFVGQFVGPEGMGAVSLVYPISLINMAVSGLIGVGSSSFLSRAIGRKDKEKIKKIFTHLVILNVIINILIMIIGWNTASRLLVLFGGEGQILDYGISYTRIMLFGMFIANFGVSLNLMIRAEGRMRAAMLILSSGAIVNLILDPVFIIVFGLDVKGAGIATVIGQFCTAIISLIYMEKAQTLVPVHFSFKFFDWKIIKDVLAVGFSAMVLPLFTIVEIAVEFVLIQKYAGMNELLVFGVVMRLLILYIPPIWGIAQGLQPIIGINSGAGDHERVKKALIVFTIGGTVVAILLWIPVVFIPKTVLSWFITDPAVVEAGGYVPRLFLLLLPLYAILFNAIGYFQAAGKAISAAILVSCRMLIFYVPLQFLFTGLFGAAGLWYCNPGTDAVSLVLVFFLILFHWKRGELTGKELPRSQNTVK